MERLPVVLSIPHGGLQVPEELANLHNLSAKEILFETDAFTREIFHLQDQAARVITGDVARVFIDLNRDPSDLPPRNPDGAIKSRTIYGVPVFKKNMFPDRSLIDTLLQRYYYPYHDRLTEILEKKGSPLRLGLDCHSMAEIGPRFSPDPGQRRPMICLGNLHHTTSPPETIQRLADCFREVFDLNGSEIRINHPYAGGFITKTYGGRPIPWIQVEMSQFLYLRSPFFNYKTLQMDAGHLKHVTNQVAAVLTCFFE